jgi:1-acyl-sn-glycerol-3-phosphate acyltransferase
MTSWPGWLSALDGHGLGVGAEPTSEPGPGVTPGSGPGRASGWIPAGSEGAGRVLYRIVRGMLVVFVRGFWRVTIEGEEHLPVQGAFVIAPVHRSNVDTAVVAIVSKRRLRFMGKDSVWKYRPVAWLATTLGGFPVHRGTVDREALRRCMAVIEGGEPLVIFPEGQRRQGPVVENLFDGAAYVATRTRVPIVPVGIGGSERAMPKGRRGLRPVKIHLVIGPPIDPAPVGPGERTSRRAVAELTAELQKELQRLFDLAQAGAGL